LEFDWTISILYLLIWKEAELVELRYPGFSYGGAACELRTSDEWLWRFSSFLHSLLHRFRYPFHFVGKLGIVMAGLLAGKV
jgi:hypothetical protein